MNVSNRPPDLLHKPYEEPLLAGIELGGTKTVALLARGRAIVDRVVLPTGTPDETLSDVATWLEAARTRSGAFAALGVASFGPLCLNRGFPGYGRIATTPKQGWTDVDVLDRFRTRFDLPIALDTDVNAAALAESRWGLGAPEDVLAYITIGTGVGLGIVIDGRPLHGAMHPEFGHLRGRRLAGDGFQGTCRWHGDCLEGLVSGPAIAARAGLDSRSIDADHPVWTAVIADLAEALVSLMLTVSPQRILIGGGVGLGQRHMIALLPAAMSVRLGGYLRDADTALEAGLVASPALGADAGPLGAIALAAAALKEANAVR